MPSRSQPPNPVLVPIRILLLTIVSTLLAFAVSLLLGILGTVAWAALHHVSPTLTLAYRHFALPLAVAVGLVVLIVATVLEVRHYRQAKALAALERASF